MSTIYQLENNTASLFLIHQYCASILTKQCLLFKNSAPPIGRKTKIIYTYKASSFLDIGRVSPRIVIGFPCNTVASGLLMLQQSQMIKIKLNELKK